tara:strand:+ start:2453 stop:2923 length:471 start_codon:yes stop_codon:yes gene_type:complete
MIPELDAEMARTRNLLEKVPADKMDWCAAEGLHTIAWNANHLVDIIGWTPKIIEQSYFDIAPPDGPAEQVSSESNPSVLLKQFDNNLKAARESLVNCSDDIMAEMWSLKSGGQALFTIPKSECLRTWVLNHAVHHRGILSVYLRMCGVELTPVYDG